MHALGMVGEHRQIDLAHPLGLPFPLQRGHAACRNQAAQAAIGGAVLRIGEEGKALYSLDPATDDRAQARGFSLGVQAHHAGHGVGIGNAQRIVTMTARSLDQRCGLRRAAQEREAGGKAKLHKRRGRWRTSRHRHDMAPWGRERGIGHQP